MRGILKGVLHEARTSRTNSLTIWAAGPRKHHVRQKKVLVIQGTSGAGKSSFLRAGLLLRLTDPLVERVIGPRQPKTSRRRRPLEFADDRDQLSTHVGTSHAPEPSLYAFNPGVSIDSRGWLGDPAWRTDRDCGHFKHLATGLRCLDPSRCAGRGVHTLHPHDPVLPTGNYRTPIVGDAQIAFPHNGHRRELDPARHFVVGPR
jgi:hypothetical protein